MTVRLPVWVGLLVLAVLPSDAFAQRRAVRIGSVEMTPSDAAVTVGRTVVFTPTAYDASNNPVATAVFACQSSNPRVATVDANCIATGVAAGTTIITARTGTGPTAKSATATLRVSPAGLVEQQGAHQPQLQPMGIPQPAPAARPADAGFAAYAFQPEGSGAAVGLTLSQLRVVLAPGASQRLTYRAVRADGETAARVPIIFRVMGGGGRVVTVDSVGLIQATGEAGLATVIVEVPGNSRIQRRMVSVEVRADSAGGTPSAYPAPAPLPQPAAAGVGYLSISTLPVSTIFIDGRPCGTSLLRFEVRAGMHQLTFRVQDSTGIWWARPWDVEVGPSETKAVRNLVLVRQ